MTELNINVPTRDDFSAMLDESFSDKSPVEGSVVRGVVTGILKDLVSVDIGLKSEGRISLKEFTSHSSEADIQVGSEVDVYVDRVENAFGEAVLSREKARREANWEALEKHFNAKEQISGQIFAQVKGGYTVDLEGAVAFLPRSQIDVRPIRDATPLMNNPQPFMILKMDRRRGNIVVSRRVVLEESRTEKRGEIIANLKEGEVVEGIVKNITNYGAFVDLGGIDGLLHVTDIAWRRVGHASDVLSVGQTLNVKVVRVNRATHRVSLGMKQLTDDPWKHATAQYKPDARLRGRVTSIADYGAFVELEPGIEGLIHISEMSWVRRNLHPSKFVSVSQELEIQILHVDEDKRRISLGLKQCLDNPWEQFLDTYPKGTIIEGTVKNKTDFGLFVGLEGHQIDGMIHMTDLSWSRSGELLLEEYQPGDAVRAIVLDVDVKKERVSLGIKQLSEDPRTSMETMKRGDIITCEITEVRDAGLEVTIVGANLTTFIRRNELSRDRDQQNIKNFHVGEKVDARITLIEKRNRKITVSIKALELQEEKEAVAQYGSSDAGASLGEILGAALSRADVDTRDQHQQSSGDEPEPTGVASDSEKVAGSNDQPSGAENVSTTTENSDSSSNNVSADDEPEAASIASDSEKVAGSNDQPSGAENVSTTTENSDSSSGNVSADDEPEAVSIASDSEKVAGSNDQPSGAENVSTTTENSDSSSGNVSADDEPEAASIASDSEKVAGSNDQPSETEHLNSATMGSNESSGDVSSVEEPSEKSAAQAVDQEPAQEKPPAGEDSAVRE